MGWGWGAREGPVFLQVAGKENQKTEVFSGSRGEGLAEEGEELAEEEVGRWEGLVKLPVLERWVWLAWLLEAEKWVWFVQ